MQIQDASIVARATHEQTTTHVRNERLLVWQGDRPPTAAQTEPRATATTSGAVLVNLTEEAVRRAEQLLPQRRGADAEEELDDYQDLKTRLLAMVIESITGDKIKVVSPGDVVGGAEQAGGGDNPAASGGQEGGAPRAGWGLEYDYYEARTESEKTTYTAEGVVKTADGQEIKVKVDLRMSRELLEETRLSVRAGDARKVDPLVINFGGNGAQLTDTKFAFDLDSDGKTEQVSFVKPGGGFLALDKNGNGAIDDGTELFGPTTGDGFKELAAHDQDGNQWIDEADDVYDRLRIWSRDEAGQDSLVALGQRGVGAIWLGHLSTPFSLKNGSELLGQVATTGLYVGENGQAGTVQQVDLVA